MKINKNKMIPVIFLLAVLLAAAGYTVFIVPMAEKKEPVYTETELAQGEMVVTITESGYLEYEEHYIEYDLYLSAITQDDE